MHLRTLGHPVQATLDAITATGAQVWRTDQHGTVTTTFQGGVPAPPTAGDIGGLYDE